jgi:hypothetical protein
VRSPSSVVTRLCSTWSTLGSWGPVPVRLISLLPPRAVVYLPTVTETPFDPYEGMEDVHQTDLSSSAGHRCDRSTGWRPIHL